MKRELIDILVDLAAIVALDSNTFSGKALELVIELKAIQSTRTANEVISPTGQKGKR